MSRENTSPSAIGGWRTHWRLAHTLAAGAHIGFYVRAWAVQADWRTEVALRFVGGEHEFAALFPHLGGAYVPTLFGGMYAPLGDAW